MDITHDSYFRIGSQHVRTALPCQDYAFAGRSTFGIDYAIVSDGCSASKDSDVGSRAITHWFRNQLDSFPTIFPADPEEYKNDKFYKELFIQRFKDHFGTMWSENFIPHRECLDATLVAAFIHRAFKKGYILVAGDGAFSIKNKDGTVESFYVCIDENAPPYLSYHLNEKNKLRYLDFMAKQQARVHLFKAIKAGEGSPSFIEDSWYYASDVLENGGLVFSFDPQTTDVVSVFTDGIASFGKDGKAVPFGEVMGQFMDIKSPAGIFIGRTCISTFRKHAKENIDHYDDFSMAALKFNEEESVNKDTSQNSR